MRVNKSVKKVFIMALYFIGGIIALRILFAVASMVIEKFKSAPAPYSGTGLPLGTGRPGLSGPVSASVVSNTSALRSLVSPTRTVKQAVASKPAMLYLS